ncbi:MAG: TIGR02453 family protein [Methylobacteriaceae bacterium]|nr:TIGR02453 family protein [Methylobacteriaceae bacterium]
MAFAGFGPQALPFFKALAFHQTKEWFEANRAIYENEVKAPFGDLVEAVAAALARAGIPLKGDRKASLFRLNRDVRFSNDKRPYKTHAGAVLTRTGAKDSQGLLYIHIDPNGCFAAAGFYQPEADELNRMRRSIARAPEAYAAVIAALAKGKLRLSDEHSLTRLPRGFEAVTAPAVAEAVKRKSHICSRPIAEAKLGDAKLVNDLHNFATAALPLLEWGWSAIDAL